MEEQSESRQLWVVRLSIPGFRPMIMTATNTTLIYYDRPYAQLSHIHHQPDGAQDPIRIFGRPGTLFNLARKNRFPCERLTEPNLPVRVGWKRYRRGKGRPGLL